MRFAKTDISALIPAANTTTIRPGKLATTSVFQPSMAISFALTRPLGQRSTYLNKGSLVVRIYKVQPIQIYARFNLLASLIRAFHLAMVGILKQIANKVVAHYLRAGASRVWQFY